MFLYRLLTLQWHHQERHISAPRINDMLDQLHGATIFSSVDLTAGFWQVPLVESAKEKTAFICREGLFHFNTMLVGLCNATHTFQRLMDRVLGRLRWECTLAYIDDVNIYLKDFNSHLIDLQRIFSRIGVAGFKLKAKKCSFGLPELIYLGHVVLAAGLKLDPNKIQAVRDFLKLANLECTQSFIGLINHCRRFVFRLCHFSSSLYKLLKKGTTFVWGSSE